MSASPFRSHLLQQWARTNQKRPPVAIVPWLKPTAGESNGSDAEEESKTRHRRQHRDRKHGSSSHHGPPSLSSVDSNSFASSSSWSESCDSSRRSARSYSSSVARIPRSPSSSRTLERARPRNQLEKKRYASVPEEAHNQGIDFDNDSDGSDDDQEYLSSALQSLLLDRRTATRLTFTLENRDAEEQQLLEALDRAVECAQMAPNHKRTEPFSFKRFLASSQTARDLAEISYQVTLAKTQSIPNANGKRTKWLGIPAFLVAMVHENQNPVDYAKSSSTATSSYEALPFSPLETERQLEDYASASAAVQNVLLSLHSEGIGSKWATGPVIRTRAFRELVQATPDDRIAALIMVGGTTEFQNDRERAITESRRHRSRTLQGDLLQDLP